jgi:four helix bundle protein
LVISYWLLAISIWQLASKIVFGYKKCPFYELPIAINVTIEINSMLMRNFRNLEIWQLAMEIVQMVYVIVKKLPNSELFGISLQMRRAVISMPSNIAEGCSRGSNKDTRRFFEISVGSAFELETQLIACSKIGYCTEAETTPIIAKLNVFQKRTNKYMQALS